VDASWFRTADKLHAPNWPTLYDSASYKGQTGNHTYLWCRNLILEEHENFNIELQRSRLWHRHRNLWASMADGPAAPSVFNVTVRTSGPVICSYMTGWGSQGREPEETIVDRSTDLASGCFIFSSTWCTSQLLNFSTCY